MGSIKFKEENGEKISIINYIQFKASSIFFLFLGVVIIINISYRNFAFNDNTSLLVPGLFFLLFIIIAFWVLPQKIIIKTKNNKSNLEWFGPFFLKDKFDLIESQLIARPQKSFFRSKTMCSIFLKQKNGVEINLSGGPIHGADGSNDLKAIKKSELIKLDKVHNLGIIFEELKK